MNDQRRRSIYAKVAALALFVAVMMCSCSPTQLAANHGLPPDPYTDVVLQVVDLSRAANADSEVNFLWNLTLSDANWANYLAKSISVLPPDDTSGQLMSEAGLVKDTAGTYVAVLGLWKPKSNISAVTYGKYTIASYGLFDNSSSTPPAYYHVFNAKNPDGAASGTYYTDMETKSPTLADVADFTVTMYSDGLKITRDRGALARADAVVLDFYSSSSSSSIIAELTLSPSMISALASSGSIVVKPASLAHAYSGNSVTSSSKGWYVEYYTVDSPEASLATRTEYIYSSLSDKTVNSTGKAAPTSFPAFSVSPSASKHMRSADLSDAPSFLSAAEGAEPYLREDLLRR
jgi:hypothetical protein